MATSSYLFAVAGPRYISGPSRSRWNVVDGAPYHTVRKNPRTIHPCCNLKVDQRCKPCKERPVGFMIHRGVVFGTIIPPVIRSRRPVKTKLALGLTAS